MTKHYHVLMGPHQGPSLAEGVYDKYEDSVFDFTGMARRVFGNLFTGEDEITLEKVIDETSKNGLTVVGTQRLCVFWFTCDENCDLHNVN